MASASRIIRFGIFGKGRGAQPIRSTKMMPKAKICGAMALALAVAGYAGYAAGEIHQTHMDNALSALKTARSELSLAARNKSGHRARAATLVDQAITQVLAGIEAREDDAEHH